MGNRFPRVALLLGATAFFSWGQSGSSGFVQASNGKLTLNGSPFRFGGVDSYVLMFESRATVDQILGAAQSAGLKTVRMWAFDDVYYAGSGSQFYLQYWNGSAPAYNDSSSNGLGNVDYAIYRAGQLGIKLIIPFVNNWHDYGGMDEYVDWRGLTEHDQFYTDATIRQWYKNWISHLLNHVNSLNGLAYKNDPTIMAWELANEPQCNGDGLPTSGTCTPLTIEAWILDAAAYVKSVDSNHLVAVGDEGFFCNPLASDYIENCSTGVDSVLFSLTPNVDLMGFHLYPESWGESLAWADTYIDQHLSDGAGTVGKPVYMGEFGIMSGNVRESVFNEWTNRIFNEGGSGALFWDILPGTPPPSAAESSDQFDVEQGSAAMLTEGNFAQMMTANSAMTFPPVAGYQWASGASNQPIGLDVLNNDVAYAGATINPSSIDLDPNTAGQQTSLAVTGGLFSATGQGIQFVPTSGFTGSASASYTVADTNGQTSNTGYLFVNVVAPQTNAAILDSFESGADGWGAAPASSAAGTVQQTSAFHTDGDYGLQVNVTSSGWFGITFPSAVNLTGQASVSIDAGTTTVGGSTAIAFQSGSNFGWCQTPDAGWQTLSIYSSLTLSLSLNPDELNCFNGPPDLTAIHTIFVYFGGTGTYYLDNLRAIPAPGSPALPLITGVANAAGYQGGAAAGTYISIYGSGFAPAGSAAVTWTNSIVNGNLPTTLAGVSAGIGGTPAYIYFVSPNQINVLAPNLGTGPMQVTVTAGSVSSEPYDITAQILQPALFTWPGNYAVATDASTYAFLVKNGTFPGVTTAPAKPGEVIILWATGFGPTNPVAPAGQVTAKTPTYYTASAVTVTIGGVSAAVYATALSPGYAGLYQIAVTLPANLADGDYPIIATINGQQTPTWVNLTVQK